MRSAAKQKAVIGFETTPGVPAPPTFRPVSGKFTIQEMAESDEIVPSGNSTAGLVYETGRGSTAKWEGVPDYKELPHLLSAAFGLPVATAVVGSPGSYDLDWEPREDLQTWTGTTGDAGKDYSRASFLFAQGFDVEWNRKGRTGKINMNFGGGLFEDLLWTTDPWDETELPTSDSMPILPRHIDVFAAKGLNVPVGDPSTQVKTMQSVKLNVSDIADSDEYLVSAAPSIQAVITGIYSYTLELVTVANLAGKEYSKNFFNGDVLTLEIRATRDANNKLSIVAPYQVKEIGERGPEGNTQVAKYTLKQIERGDAKLKVRLRTTLVPVEDIAVRNAADFD